VRIPVMLIATISWFCIASVFTSAGTSGAQVTDRATETVSDAQSAGGQTEAIVLLWSNSIPEPGSMPGVPPLALTDVARFGKGFTFLLSKANPLDKGAADRPFLLVGADQSGPGRLIPLNITGWGLRLVPGPDQTIWIGGVKNPGVLWTGEPVSDGYLAKLDAQGGVIWERQFADKHKREIQSLAPLPSGDVVVVGRYDNKTWLARISGDGQLVWERYLGVGNGVSVTTIGDKIAVAAFKAAPGSSSQSYREDVGFWTYDTAAMEVQSRSQGSATRYMCSRNG
jgi:hypothetical protein